MSPKWKDSSESPPPGVVNSQGGALLSTPAMKAKSGWLLILGLVILLVAVFIITERVAEGLWVKEKFLAWMVGALAIIWAITAVLAGIFRIEYGVAILLIGFPIINRPVEYLYFITGPIMVNTFSMALYLLCILALPKIENLKRTRADKWLLFFIILSLAPNLLAKNPTIAIRSYISGVVEPILLFFLIRVAFNKENQLKFLLSIFGGFLLVHWSLIMAEAIKVGGIITLVMARLTGGTQGVGVRLFSGGLNEPLQASWIIIMLLPLYQFASPYLPRWWYSIFAAGIIMEILAGLSRSVIFLLPFELLLAYWIARRWRFKEARRNLKLNCLLVLLLAIIFVPLLISRFGGAKNVGYYADPNILGGREMEINMIAYLSFINVALEMAISYPFGIGLSNAPFYREAVGGSPLIAHLIMPNMHSLLPHAGLSIHHGALAAICFLAFLISLSFRTREVALSRAHVFVRALAAGLFVSIVFNGLLYGKMDLVPSGGYLMDGGIALTDFPTNQQVIWSFAVLALASLVGNTRGGKEGVGGLSSSTPVDGSHLQ